MHKSARMIRAGHHVVINGDQKTVKWFGTENGVITFEFTDGSTARRTGGAKIEVLGFTKPEKR